MEGLPPVVMQPTDCSVKGVRLIARGFLVSQWFQFLTLPSCLVTLRGDFEQPTCGAGHHGPQGHMLQTQPLLAEPLSVSGLAADGLACQTAFGRLA